MLEMNNKMMLSQKLRKIADSLDISEALYKDAENRYQAVGKWLSQEDSPIGPFDPDIYTQGSFRLGTVIKPTSHEDEYDIDLVCQLNILKNSITQEQLKKMVGDRLKANGTYEKMLDKEGKRCWTLNYAESAKFHMDILPAIPDNYGWLLNQGVPDVFAKTAICITDKDQWNFVSKWPRSNPIGYAEWFKNQMKVIFNKRRQFLAEKLQANIEDVPDYKIKTPLQRSIQLLKRHRDVYFQNDNDNKPISIIITTLAAHAYNNESDLLDSMITIIQGMQKHIESRDGIPWVANPVNPAENFADKWHTHPERKVNFIKWIYRVQRDLNLFLTENDNSRLNNELKSSFGERAVPFEVKTTNRTIPILSQSSNMAPAIFNVPHRQPLKWGVRIIGKVTIEAKASKSGDQTLYLSSNSQKIPKYYSLTFTAKTDILPPFSVYWQVVNTGLEALNNNCLRGGFELSSLIHNESTSYSGMHWVECFIVKNGICVARSGEFVVNIE